MSSNNDNNSEVAVDKVENNDKGDSKVEKGIKRPSEDKGVDPKKAKVLNGDEDEVDEDDEDVEAEEEEEEEEDIPDGEEEEDEEGDGEGEVEGDEDDEDQ